MAHKGKLYQYLFNRDLSLSPGQTWGLPQAWRWTGILATGSKAHYFVGQTFDLELYGLESRIYGAASWAFNRTLPGGLLLNMTILYQLTFLPSMSQMWWNISDESGELAFRPPTNTTAAWPYNQAAPPTYQRNPALLNVVYPGNFFPKPW